MRSSDHAPPLHVLSQNELRQLVAGEFGAYQTGSLRVLAERLRNTAETPSTLPRRPQLQAVQQRLQAQYDTTPVNGAPSGAPTRQQFQQVISEMARYECQPSLSPQRPTQAQAGAQQGELSRETAAPTTQSERAATSSITTTSAQQCAAQDAIAQLKPLLANHTVFTSSSEQRVNLLLHLHTLMNSELRFTQPQTQPEFASFINQRDSGNASSRLDYLQIMTAFLRGSPNTAITSQINALLSSQLAQNMALEQILVPRSAGSMSGEAVLAQFADFTPEAKKLFLLKLARATLTICQLITSELAQASQAVRTSSSSTETSPSATPEPFGPAEQTDSEDESPPQSTEVTPVIELATQQPSADAVTEAGLDEMNAAPTSPEEPDIATANSAPINRRSLSRSFSKLFRHKADDEAIKQALIKKLDDACRRNGVIQELERKRIEMSAFRYNPMSKKDFAKKLEDGKALLEQFNQNMHLLQDDNELFYRFLKVFALVLHTKLLDEMFAPSHREDVGLSLGFVSLPHYQTILSFLENAAPPWDFDVIYQKIKDFFNAVHIENIDENIPEQIIEIELFTLADVSLNPNAKLPNNYYLKALGLSPQATINEMRSAYKRLCLQYHPDKNSGDEAQATAMFLRLQIVATQLKIIL